MSAGNQWDGQGYHWNNVYKSFIDIVSPMNLMELEKKSNVIPLNTQFKMFGRW